MGHMFVADNTGLSPFKFSRCCKRCRPTCSCTLHGAL